MKNVYQAFAPKGHGVQKKSRGETCITTVNRAKRRAPRQAPGSQRPQRAISKGRPTSCCNCYYGGAFFVPLSYTLWVYIRQDNTWYGQPPSRCNYQTLVFAKHSVHGLRVTQSQEKNRWTSWWQNQRMMEWHTKYQGTQKPRESVKHCNQAILSIIPLVTLPFLRRMPSTGKFVKKRGRKK